MTKARDIANAGTALSSVDATELGYLDGVTSNIQTQFSNISGSKAQPSEPASPTDGMIWVDTDGTALINQLLRWSKAPAGGTTTLSGNDDNSVPLTYSVGYEQVFQNGALLARGSDYTATNGTSISLTNASVTGDIFEVFAAQPVAISDVYTQTQANAAFINDSLLTTTGDIIYASGANTPARLGIGSTDQILKVSGGVPVWATPSATTPTFVGCAVYNNNMSNTFTSGTALIIGLDAESIDTNGFHDNATNNSRITIPAGYAGKYLITAHWDLNGVSAYYLGQIRKNGSNAVNGTNRTWAQNAGGNNFAAGDAIIIDTANVGDYYEMSMQLGQTGTLTSNYYRFSAIYLGA